MPRLHKFNSKSIEGASFALKTPGSTVRNQVEFGLCEEFHQQRLIAQEQLQIISQEDRATSETLLARVKNLTPEELDSLDRLQIREAVLARKVDIARVRVMLESFTIPGDDADVQTTEDLLDFGPVPLVDEIIVESRKLWGLSAEETKNS